MDVTLLGILTDQLLPAELAAQVRTHVLSPQSPVQACRRQAIAYSRAAAAALADLAARLAADNQGVAAGALALALLALAVLVARWLSRLVLWWTRLTLRLAGWAVVAAVVAAVWSRGPAASVRDAAVVAGQVVGYLRFLRDVWLDEYSRYEGQQRQGARAGPGRGSSARY